MEDNKRFGLCRPDGLGRSLDAKKALTLGWRFFLRVDSGFGGGWTCVGLIAVFFMPTIAILLALWDKWKFLSRRFTSW